MRVAPRGASRLAGRLCYGYGNEQQEKHGGKRDTSSTETAPETRPPRQGPGSFWSELFQLGLYKRSQGRIARQVTFFALVVLFAVGCWSLNLHLSPRWLLGWTGLEISENANNAIRYGIVISVLALGVWFSFRLVNAPRFADFLIAVEAEMNKVSWPSRSELFRSSIVVIVLLMILTAVLFVYDIVWSALFKALGILG